MRALRVLADCAANEVPNCSLRTCARKPRGKTGIPTYHTYHLWPRLHGTAQKVKHRHSCFSNASEEHCSRPGRSNHDSDGG